MRNRHRGLVIFIYFQADTTYWRGEMTQRTGGIGTSESCRKPDFNNVSQQYQIQIENLLKTYSTQHLLDFYRDSEQQSASLFAQFNTFIYC